MSVPKLLLGISYVHVYIHLQNTLWKPEKLPKKWKSCTFNEWDTTVFNMKKICSHYKYVNFSSSYNRKLTSISKMHHGDIQGHANLFMGNFTGKQGIILSKSTLGSHPSCNVSRHCNYRELLTGVKIALW